MFVSWTLAVAVLLSSGRAAASGGAGDAHQHQPGVEAQHAAARHEQWHAPAGALSSSGSRGGDLSSSDAARRHRRCGGLGIGECLLMYHAAFLVAFILLVVVAVVLWLSRRWRVCSRDVRRRRGHARPVSDEESDGAPSREEGRAYEPSRGLLSSRHRRGREAVVDDDEDDGEPAHGSAGVRHGPGSCIHRLNLPKSNVWWFLKYTPAGLFYRSSPTSAADGEGGRAVASITVDVGERVSEGDVDTRGAVRHRGQAASATPSPRPAVSLAHVIKTDTSDSGHDGSSHSEREDEDRAGGCSRECSRGERLHAEVERPAHRSCTADERWSAFLATTHLSPFLPSFDDDADVEEHLAADCGNSQRPCDTLRSTASTGSRESSSRTPPPATDTPALSRRASGSSVSVCDADATQESVYVRHALPHVDTAIFDGTAAATGSLGAVDGDGCTGAAVPCALPPCEAPRSSVGSHISEVDGIAAPWECASTALPSPAALTASHLPVDELAIAAVVDVVEAPVDAPAECGECVGPAPPSPPPVPARRRRSSRYSEPWQPVLAAPPQAAPFAAAATMALPSFSAPVSPVRVCASPCSELAAPGGDLDDLMLVEEQDSAQSNVTGEYARVFSGSSTSTSRTVTPATEVEQEMIGTPPVAAAFAAGGGVYAGLESEAVLATSSIPLYLPSPPIAVYARTVGAVYGLLGKDDEDDDGRPCRCGWPSRSAQQRRPLNLSVEERTLLLKSRRWLYPLVRGFDEVVEEPAVSASPADPEDDDG
ncbi:hypothetical protein NESM_000503200 [Novymonas esmeraldas]|uniref:Uncharacterized protein n=1 Tax=Novymonas esmeraldas TaxID=1808958 RepID=A0AAW0EPT0_9TRYP